METALSGCLPVLRKVEREGAVYRLPEKTFMDKKEPMCKNAETGRDEQTEHCRDCRERIEDGNRWFDRGGVHGRTGSR